MQLVPIGKIAKTHGLKGEVKFVPFAADDESLAWLENVHLTKNGESPIIRKVESLRGAGTRLILKLKDCNSIEEAKDMAGWTLAVRREDFKKLPEGEYYRFEIEGLDVFDEDGRHYGKVMSVIATGSNDVYVVSDGKKEILLPMIDPVIRKIDLKERKMIFQIVEGLLEEDKI